MVQCERASLGQCHEEFCRRQQVYKCVMQRFMCDSHPSSAKSFPTLQSLAAPVITLAASIWIDFNCFYPIQSCCIQAKGEHMKYTLFPEIFLITLYLRVRIRLNLVHVLLMCSVQGQLLERIRPSNCLWIVVPFIIVLCIKKEG